MHIKLIIKHCRFFGFVLIAILLMVSLQTSAQIVFERQTNEVYPFLNRMAQKGILTFDDLILPLTKDKIKIGLDSIQFKISVLSQVEKSELAFYLNKFSTNQRNQKLAFRKNDFSFDVTPLVTVNFRKNSNETYLQTGGGVQFYGNATKNIGFQFAFQDFTEKGDGIHFTRNRLEDGTAVGIIPYDTFSRKKINYAEVRAHINLKFKNGQLSVGQDYLTFGYGENGKIVLSDKAPTYPYVRLDYQLLPKVKFNYTHAWLHSNLVDSARSYTIPGGGFGGIREVDISKFMATHSLDFTLRKGLNFTIGESMIYNDRINIGYCIPILFFKAFDNYFNRGAIQKGSNGQFFISLSARNQLPNTHFYSTLLIDEIKISKIFDKRAARNQLGYNVGASVTDLGLPYLTMGIEYTRLRPFVYRNFLPAQNYSHAGYFLGDWMGNNSDRLLLFLKYTPLPKLKILARYQKIRKGGEGTIDQQYNQQPQPSFLFDFKESQKDIFLQVKYEWINRLCFTSNYTHIFGGSTFSTFGVTYGL